MLSNTGGSKNIIFVSDGKTTNDELKLATLSVVRTINAKGVKVFVVGVGTDTDSLAAGNSIFLARREASTATFRFHVPCPSPCSLFL